MTLTDAKRIGQLIRHADDGCTNCVGDLVDRANKMFPAFEFVMDREGSRVRDGWDYFQNKPWYSHRPKVMVTLR